MFILHFLILLHSTIQISAKCDGVQKSLPFVIEYGVSRGWREIALYTAPNQHGCLFTTVRIAKCLSVNGIGVVQPHARKLTVVTQIGIVVLAPRLNTNGLIYLTNTLNKLNELKMNTESHDWLISLQTFEDLKNLTKVLKVTPIRFDQNIVVSYPKGAFIKSTVCEGNFVYNRRNGNSMETERFSPQNGAKNRINNNSTRHIYRNNYYKNSIRFKNLVKNKTYIKDGIEHALYRSGLNYNYSREFHMDKKIKKVMNEVQTYESKAKPLNKIEVLQYFKVRPNSTLYQHLLGTWSLKTSMASVEAPYPVEARNFLGEELYVGRCNSSGDGLSEFDETESTTPELLENVLHFITVQLNATKAIRNFNKLGFRSFEGIWTGLLGELVNNKVDIALEPVTAYLARYHDMDFIFPIAKTMCSIYIRHQETLTRRDIFVSPFSPRLLMCVLAIAIFMAILAIVISRLLGRVLLKPETIGVSEALLWATGILCQQGAIITPRSAAARVLLITSLLFAVITYNSYAAFITSILSVRVTTVDTVEAVLQAPNIKIGYIRNGADQMYLMSTKDTQLNAFYIRGYSAAENLVTSVEDGLVRAATQDYAFFTGQRAARTKLKTFSKAKGKCLLHELPVQSTKANLAFPIPHNSAYAKKILLSLISLKSGGLLPLLGDALMPNMPECAPPPGFTSARAADVCSAFLLLGLGFLLALILGTGESICKNKLRLQKYIRRRCRNIVYCNYY